MKKTAIGLALALCLAALPAIAQEKTALIAPNLIGPIFGYYSANVEFKIGDQLTLEIEPGYFNLSAMPLLGSLVSSSGLKFWYANCKLGLDYYSKEAFKGGFAGAYAKGSYFRMGDDSFSVDTGAAGLGAKVGYRWTGGWVSFALGATYEYNMAFASVPNENGGTSLFTSAVDGGMPGAFILFSFVL